MRTTLLAFGLLLAPVPHDSFISILTIHHNTEKKELDLTWRMTAHDIEHALEPQGRLQLASPHELPKADSLINAYLNDHLLLDIHGSPLRWKWIGKELQGENLYCYLQIDSVADPEGLTVSNTLLQDVFGDQQNIVHLEMPDVTFTHDFARDSEPFTFHVK